MSILMKNVYGKLIFTLSKEFKNMSVKEFDKELASLVHDLRVYITSYTSKLSATLSRLLLLSINLFSTSLNYARPQNLP